MSIKRLKHNLTELKQINVFPNYQIICSALIGASIIFLQSLVVTSNIDIIQIIAMIFFSIAIPILSFYFLAIVGLPNQKKHAKIYAPAYLASGLTPLFSFGSVCVGTGITFLLINVSVGAAILFAIIGYFGMRFVIALKKQTMIMIDQEEQPE